jgi:hypothetical protein
MSGSSPKQLEATARNAQRFTSPRIPADGVAAIHNRGSLTIGLKSFGVPEDMPMEELAVAYPSRFSHKTISADTLNNVRCQGTIEPSLDRATYSLQEHRGLSHPEPSETPPIAEN